MVSQALRALDPVLGGSRSQPVHKPAHDGPNHPTAPGRSTQQICRLSRSCMQMIVAPMDGRPDDLTIERDTFGTFFREHYGRLGKAMFLLTGDADEAEDLAQDAMVRVCERWDRVASMGSPEGYLYRTAMNLYRGRLRRASVRLRRRTVRSDVDPLEAAEDRGDIGRLLRSLPAGQRDALILVEWLGLSTEDAASILGIKPGSVRARVSRAKAALRSEQSAEEDSR